MDLAEPPSQNGLPDQNHSPALKLMEAQNSVEQNGVENKQPKIDIESQTSENLSDSQQARGLELIYQVAAELATRIAEEKRYEGIIKPCSVSLQRIPDSSQYRIIRDANMIIDETPKSTPKSPRKQLFPPKDSDDQSISFLSMNIEASESSDEEGEIIISSVEEEQKVDEGVEITQETVSFFCIFCHQKNIRGKIKATEHYQLHLDYYPYKCSQCLEVATDKRNLINHYRKDHKDETTARFKKKLKPWISDWIEAFLLSQINNVNRRKLAVPRAYCPVCESSEKKEDIIQLPPNLIQPRKQLIHIFKHLVYEPYVCVLCQKLGKLYSVCDFDQGAYEHVLRNHPEAENSLLREVFHKSRYIKPLESFIVHYLTCVGVSTRRRMPEKIPNFVINKFRSKQENKEKEKINGNKDNSRGGTLGDLVNQTSSTSLVNDQSDVLIIGQSAQKTDILPVLSNQIKTNPKASVAQTNKANSTIHKTVTMLTSSNNLLLSPSKGLPNYPVTHINNIVTTEVNNLPITNCIAVSSLNATNPNRPLINGNSSNQPSSTFLLSNCQPTSSIFALPNGQLVFRNPIPRISPPIQMKPIINQTNSSIRSILIKTVPGSSSLKSPSLTTPPTDLNKILPVSIQVSPDIESYGGTTPIKPKQGEFVARKYFCMFCRDDIFLQSFTDALFHFSKHLNYRPVTCLLCNDKFQDINSVMQHFNSTHPHADLCQDDAECSPLLYYINREGETEKWIEEYVYFQVTGEIDIITNPDFASHCFICQSMLNLRSYLQRSIKSARLTPSVEVAREHLNLHLNYRPYECYLCSKNGKQVRLSSIGETAVRHLRGHGYIPNDKNFLKEFFLFKPILELEKFSKSYFITEFYPYANVNGYGRGNLPSLLSDPSPMTNSLSTSPRSYSRYSGENVAKRLFINADHNSRSIDLKRLGKTTLACYHCKLTLSGLKELLSHCKSIHPNLSIASYAIPVRNSPE